MTVALYWDFENLHAGLCEEKEPGAYARGDFRFKPQEPLVDVQAVVELASSFGPIAVNRAYCNWQFYGRYRDALLQNAVELIQLFPPGGAAKNGADIKLCLDAMEDVGRFGHIGTVIVVGGDSDFMPLAQKIKAAGRTLVGVGTRQATNRHWARSCHEFRYYDDVAQAHEPGADIPAELVRRALRLLAHQRGDAWVDAADIWRMVKRLDPTFQLAEHGHATVGGMLEALESLVELRQGEGGQQVRLR
jgi:uncharacterized LabA/DUF88 family protein